MTPCPWASDFWWLSEGMCLHHQGPTDHRILGTSWHFDTQHHIKTFWLDTQHNIGTSWHSNTHCYIGDLLTWHSVILGPLDVAHGVILGTSWHDTVSYCNYLTSHRTSYWGLIWHDIKHHIRPEPSERTLWGPQVLQPPYCSLQLFMKPFTSLNQQFHFIVV
jgi:hypothetical protein